MELIYMQNHLQCQIATDPSFILVLLPPNITHQCSRSPGFLSFIPLIFLSVPHILPPQKKSLFLPISLLSLSVLCFVLFCFFF